MPPPPEAAVPSREYTPGVPVRSDFYASQADLYDLAFSWDVEDEAAWLHARFTRGAPRTAPVATAVIAGIAGVVVVSPWFLRQLSVFGSLSPSTASGRLLYIRDFSEWNSISTPATLDWLLGMGAGPLLLTRLGGLAYHFIVGNGQGSADGEVETGYRWRDQIPGPHTKNQQANLESIAICVVGDLQAAPPTEKQLGALLDLAERLCRECGIPAARVISHREVDHETQCPGKGLPMDGIRAAIAARLASKPLAAPTAR